MLILVNQWRNENHGVSSTHQLSMHPAYQEIISMGEEAVPLLLKELEKKSGQWFGALKSITKVDPVTRDGEVACIMKRVIKVSTALN